MAIGLSLIGLFAWWIQENNLVLDGPKLVEVVPPATAVVALGLLVAFSALLGRRGLRKGELLVIYAMLMVATPLASIGLVHNFFPGLVNGAYLVGAGSTKYVAYQLIVPNWLRPWTEVWEQGRMMSIFMPESLHPAWFPALDFFQGRATVPWNAWMAPLIAWGVLFATTFAVSLSVATVLRVAWVDQERLAMPLNQIPLSITGSGEAFSARLGDFFKDPWMWAGASISVLVYGVIGLGHYVPELGDLPLGLDMAMLLIEKPWNAMAPFHAPFVFAISPMFVGIAFLLPLDILFSVWVFFLFSRLELLVADLFGYGDERLSRAFGVEWPPLAPYPFAQARGGLVAIGLLSLWGTRRHLKRVWQIVVGRATDATDAHEPMSYRTAAVMGITASVVWIGWVSAAGLSLSLALGYFGLLVLMMIAVSRLRLDAGMPIFIGLPMVSHFFHITFGTAVFGRQDYAIMAMLNVFGYTMIGSMLMVQMEGFGLAGEGKVPQKQMTWGLTIAFIAGLVLAFVLSLQTFYEHGLSDLDAQGGALHEARIGRYYDYSYQTAGDDSSPSDSGRLLATGVGFVVTWSLTMLRRIWIGWPLHPLGYVFGAGFLNQLAKDIWAAMLVGWLAKVLVVKYGGGNLFKRVRPLFLGLIVGELTMRMFWAVIALIVGEMGQHLLLSYRQWTWLR